MRERACLRRWRIDGCGNTDCVDVVVPNGLVRVANGDVPLLVGEAGHRVDDVLADERGHDHGVAVVEGAAVVEREATVVDRLHPNIAYGSDAFLLHEQAEELLTVG